MSHFDFIVIGAGMAGASIAAELSQAASVLLLEAEAYPGYHATGRSVAFWTESYGGPGVQPLTTASGPLLADPPTIFASQPLMKRRGALHLGKSSDAESAHRLLSEFSATSVAVERISVDAINTLIPQCRLDWQVGIWESGCCDIDVAALHQAYLRQFKRRGGKIACRAAVAAASFHAGSWSVDTMAGQYSGATLINAAGAWADQIAALASVKPLAITPMRRTVVQLETVPVPPVSLPLVIGLDGSFYFKPDGAGRIWLSPHDETPSVPCDAAAEEIDVAVAIERFQQVVDWKITRIEQRWAGLRSFAPDRLPVIGRDQDNDAFFWFAGQGGFGIQTAPAAARLAAYLLTGAGQMPTGVDAERYNPARFR